MCLTLRLFPGESETIRFTSGQMKADCKFNEFNAASTERTIIFYHSITAHLYRTVDLWLASGDVARRSRTTLVLVRSGPGQEKSQTVTYSGPGRATEKARPVTGPTRASEDVSVTFFIKIGCNFLRI